MLNLLCQSIEQSLGHCIQSPKDFDQLREHIYTRLHQLISTSTLKRVWGYIDSESEPSRSTLNVLASFVGYGSYADFCAAAAKGGADASNPVVSRHINVATDLAVNDCLTLTWAPDRQCRVRYLGNMQFRVEEAAGTRLQAGDSFQCSLIVEGEPLYLANLMQPGRQATNYVCGKRGGIRFERT